MRILFEFAGGPLDGKSVVGIRGEQDEADRYFVLTHHGKIGQRFRIASDYAVEFLANEQLKNDAPHQLQLHAYRVTDRLEGEDEVLVRAEYVDKSADERLVDVQERSDSDTDTDPHSRSTQRIREILAETLRSWSTTYSHCWPREAGTFEPPTRHLMLHLAHTMLSHDFSVFVDARHPGFPGQPIDVLGIAPGQDWFLACRHAPLSPGDAQLVLPRLATQLAAFWLGPHLTADHSGDYMDRAARHCVRGYGLVSATAWTSGEGTFAPMAAEWGSQEGLAYGPALAAADVEWPEPMTLGQSSRRGTCHWLTTFFRIPRLDPNDTVSSE